MSSRGHDLAVVDAELEQLLEPGRAAVAEVVAAVAQLAGAVRSAHQQRVVHRDIRRAPGLADAPVLV